LLSNSLTENKLENPQNQLPNGAELRGITPVLLTDFRLLQSGKNDIVASYGVLNPDCNKKVASYLFKLD
jgi:hypothetical protein